MRNQLCHGAACVRHEVQLHFHRLHKERSLGLREELQPLLSGHLGKEMLAVERYHHVDPWRDRICTDISLQYICGNRDFLALGREDNRLAVSERACRA